MDIGPMVQVAAETHRIPLVGLVALGKAESNWTRTAARYGTWPDVSFGYPQITVETAASYGIGDGTPASTETVRLTLLDRQTAITLMAHHYATGLAVAHRGDPTLAGDAWLMAGMVVYNSGSYQTPGNWWYQRWAANVATYRASLAWAYAVLEPQERLQTAGWQLAVAEAAGIEY